MTTAGPLAAIVAACRVAETEADLDAATAEPLAALNDDPGPDGADLEIGRVLVDAAAARLRAEARLTDLGRRVDQAQQLANMGDYDWHIDSDTVVWSDQLYRIFGYEPQSFVPSYADYIKHIHPDDQESSREVHETAQATGASYYKVSKMVRADGDVRYLSSNGSVVHDAAGVPVRMQGTSVDVTDLVHAQEEASRNDRWVRRLVESFPEAILALGRDGRVVQANERAVQLFEGDPGGQRLSDLVTDPELEGPDRAGLSLTGAPLRLDVVLGRATDEDDPTGDELLTAFIRDSRPRIELAAKAARLHESQVRRQQALELNDVVVQGIAAALLAQGQERHEEATMYLDRTVAAARQLMNEWIEPTSGAEPTAGDLLRSSSSGPPDDQAPPRADTVGPASDARADSAASAPAAPRVLIVDDNDDVRRLIEIQLAAGGSYDVVGLATNGREAVALATELQPDVVLLDLAMPVMDGLEALPLIKAAVPQVQVIVLSGFDQDAMRDVAIRAGAAKYVEKGVRMGLPGHIDEVMGR